MQTKVENPLVLRGNGSLGGVKREWRVSADRHPLFRQNHNQSLQAFRLTNGKTK